MSGSSPPQVETPSMRAFAYFLALLGLAHGLEVSRSRSCSRRCALAAGAATLWPSSGADAKKPPKPIEVTDRYGAPITEAGWLKEVGGAGAPDLVLGIDGEPYFLLTKAGGDEGERRELVSYALRAECTHLGCLVQPEMLGGGFGCPCHGSKYSAEGAVTRGPAPRSLALARVEAREGDGVLMMSPWDGPDFRAS
jgi:Rieske Fe-S protein